MTADPVAFLRARLDDTARKAQDAAEFNGQHWDVPSTGVVQTDSELLPTGDRGLALHIAENDPARVLTEVDAKRRIVARHEVERDPKALRFVDGGADGLYCTECFGQRHPCETLRLLALPYADHPDYREEWRP